MPKKSALIKASDLQELARQINSLFAECEEALETAQNAQRAALETAR